MSYRERIQTYYERLSPSYRRVADFILARYYDVAFMTAAQLAQAVDVDTTTVVRFAQRLGYNGYPELLQEIRRQVKEEIYGVYQPQPLAHGDPAAVFKAQVERDMASLRQILVHNPASLVQEVVAMLEAANRIFLVAESYAGPVAHLLATELRHHDIRAEALPEDPVNRAATLADLESQDVVVGLTVTTHGESVARVLEFARSQGCRTLALVGSLENEAGRVADRVIHAPSEGSGSLQSVVPITAAATGLAQALAVRRMASPSRQRRFTEVYHFLIRQPISEEAEVAN